MNWSEWLNMFCGGPFADRLAYLNLIHEGRWIDGTQWRGWPLRGGRIWMQPTPGSGTYPMRGT